MIKNNNCYNSNGNSKLLWMILNVICLMKLNNEHKKIKPFISQLFKILQKE